MLRTNDPHIFFFRDWHLHRWTPFVRYFPESHTGVAIKLSLGQMIEDLGLHVPEIWKVAVNDNASNCVKAIRLSDDLFQYLCAIHTLQLAIGDTLKATSVAGVSMKSLLKKCETLANHVKRSGPATLSLKAACKEVKISYTILKNPNKTRWNSQHTNLKSVIKLKPALVKLSNEDTCGDWSTWSLSPSEWKLAEESVAILEQPLMVTKAWEAETSPTMNLVVEQLYRLKMKVEAYTPASNCRYIMMHFIRAATLVKVCARFHLFIKSDAILFIG